MMKTKPRSKFFVTFANIYFRGYLIRKFGLSKEIFLFLFLINNIIYNNIIIP